MKQDDDWTEKEVKLDKKLYYADQPELVEAGNRKFACSFLKSFSRSSSPPLMCGILIVPT